MNKEQILEKLQSINKKLRLPSGMGFSIEDKVLTIMMKEKGLTANMQTDASAFEGWAICLKAWLPECITEVIIAGDVLSFPKGEKMTKEEMHYNRFLYRLLKFTETYNWAKTNDYADAIKQFKEFQLVVNVPNNDAEERASHKESKLERAYCVKYKAFYNTIDHQLPVRLFKNNVKKGNAITPGGFIDIWSIKENVLNIYELKIRSNTHVGIISELMYYLYVVTDIMTSKISIPKFTPFRSQDKFFDLYQKKSCKKINAYLLADVLHPMIEKKKEDILKIMNDGEFSRRICYFHKKVCEYNCLETEKHCNLVANSFFGKAKVNGPMNYYNKNLSYTCYPDYVLDPANSDINLFPSIRCSSIEYFKLNNIAWWRESLDGYSPTGHLVSSQIHCLNHLFAFRKDADAVKTIIQNLIDLKIKTGLMIKELLPSPLDKDGGYITFEFVCKNKTLLGEKHETRGANCTSVDAVVLAETEKKKKILIPIEWKYTESYEKNDNNKADLAIVEKRYTTLAKNEKSNLGDWPDKFNWDPLYEFARQTLLMEQIKAKPEISGIDNVHDYIHIIVRPDENKEICEDIRNFKKDLKNTDKVIEIDPLSFLEPLRSNTQYSDLINYLETRYWNAL